MANIFHLDYVNGSDANSGLSWATAWRTLTGGATAARIAPGDIIRIAKSPPPVGIGNATWTNLSRAVTLATAQTTTINLCETAWTAAANVTATASTTRKEGANAASLAIAAGFTTGRVAHQSFAVLDLSAFQRITFWIRTSVAISAGWLRVALCSDTGGTTIIDNFAIPAIPSTGRYVPLTIARTGGGNLGASIQSIAVYADVDPGTPTLLLDNFLACAADGLNLQSLISKNSAEQGGTEGWYGIKSIVGTAVELDQDTNSLAEAGRGYSGLTETIATFRRETIKTDLASASGTVVNEVMDSGTLGNNIQFQGGFNTATSVQDGETFFDGLNGFGWGIRLNFRDFITLNLLNCFRYNRGFSLEGPTFCFFNTINASNNSENGVHLTTSTRAEIYDNTFNLLNNLNNNAGNGLRIVMTNWGNRIHFETINNVNNNGSHGIFIDWTSGRFFNSSFTTINNVNNNNVNGLLLDMGSFIRITNINNVNFNNGTGIITRMNDSKIFLIKNVNNNIIGIEIALNGNEIKIIENVNNNSNIGFIISGLNNFINSLSTSGNINGSIQFRSGITYISNALITEPVDVNLVSTSSEDFFRNFRLYSHRHQRDINNHQIWTFGGRIFSQTTVRHSLTGIAWQLNPTSTDRTEINPLWLSIARIAVNPNSQVTVKAWFRRTNTALTGRLICKGGQITGVPNDVFSDMTAAADTWQQVQIQFTPTEIGVVEIEAQAWGGTTHSLFVDDMEIIQ